MHAAAAWLSELLQYRSDGAGQRTAPPPLRPEAPYTRVTIQASLRVGQGSSLLRPTTCGALPIKGNSGRCRTGRRSYGTLARRTSHAGGGGERKAQFDPGPGADAPCWQI